ncbi:MAG: transglycosylase SLT domain-containing protein [Rhodospirillaceae bacterium]
MTRHIRNLSGTLRRLLPTAPALCLAWLLGGCAGTPTPTVVTAEAPPPATVDTYIKEASQRFNVPEKWIRAVMHQESGGRVGVVSKKGAIGLMQVMPATWAYLRDTYHLGNDPFEPHDNIMAGTAYIREMFDQYGSPGFLAAYNAGPGRYESHLRTRKPLPGETRHYVAVIGPKIEGVLPEGPNPARSTPLTPRTVVAMAAVPVTQEPPVPAVPPVQVRTRVEPAVVGTVPPAHVGRVAPPVMAKPAVQTASIREPGHKPRAAESRRPILVASADSDEDEPAPRRPGNLPAGWYVPVRGATR